MVRLLLLLVLALGAGCALPEGRVLDAPVDRPRPAAGDERPVRVPRGAQPVVVVRHTDGDTVRVEATGPGLLPRGVDVPLRLLEVDAPEESPRECFASEASAALARLLPLGERAYVVPDRDPVDRYGRHLRYVWNARGAFVNEALVRRGFATAVLFEPNDRHIERMRRAEAAARGEDRGLWGRCG